MAASAPAANASWADVSESSDKELSTKALEMGMAGMNLLSEQAPGRKATESSTISVSSSPPRLEETQPPQHIGGRRSAPGSPSFEKQSGLASQSKPPGITGPVPSPISKPGHSKNSSTASPSLTLTPNSSVDGNADWHSLGRQTSPFHNDAPTLPHLNPEHRRGGPTSDGSGSFGSFADLGVSPNENDGLLGLGALPDRPTTLSAYNHQGISSSPPVARSHFSGHSIGHHSDPERHRSVRAERPPLSHSYGDPSGDRSVGGVSLPFSTASSRSVGDPNNSSMESSDSRVFGAIGRSEFRQSAGEFDPARHRAHSDNYQSAFAYQPSGLPEQVSHKFGSLPTLGSHVRSHKPAPEGFVDLPKPRHTRSVSQPGPQNIGNVQQHLPPGLDSRFYSGVAQQHGHGFSGDSFKATRSASISHQVLSQSYEGSHFSKGGASMPNLTSSVPSGYGHTSSSYVSRQRRDPLDFHLSPGSHSSGPAFVGNDMQGFAGPNTISPGHSPHQIYYEGHSRQHSEGGTVLSAGSMSTGSLRVGGMHVGRHHSGDEDLSHPLVGEHIEVPDHDDHHPGTYYLSQSSSHPLLRNSHAHSLSLDAMPSHVIDSPHHLPTAGAGHSIPKVVYVVKFKRSQRNFVLGPRINRDLEIGTYVKVEADRGEDLGIVVGKVSSEKFGFSGRASFSPALAHSPGLGPAGLSDLKRIIRLATHDEVSLLSMKREEEEELLKICRGKVRQRGLPMNVVDAEYQFDRHKLTFFFEAEGRVDFRELVRDLFSMYKTRIWMQQLDKNTSTSAQAIVAPQAANLQIDMGTPIIAPASEFADSIVLSGTYGADSRSY